MNVSTETSSSAKPHMNPYWAGFGLGLVLLAAFVVMGRGLGASGAIIMLLNSALASHLAEALGA